MLKDKKITVNMPITKYKRYKTLYSITQEGVKLAVTCGFTEHTNHIGIYTNFGKGYIVLQRKSVYSHAQEGVSMRITCVFTEHTNHIGIYTNFYKAEGWKGGAVTNPSCTIYLGVVVAERVLSKVFKNVQRMPPNNVGYDIICNNGFKIDIKSACQYPKNDPKSWVFAIKRNQEADYFLCLAFDDRNNLNPQHIWLIPGKVVNHLTSTSISTSTLDKWAQYELTDKLYSIIACCDTLKHQS